MTEGRKYDAEKRRFDLLSVPFLYAVVDVLTFGARKYAPNNWLNVRHGRSRYYAASLRHLTAWRTGETSDAETGIHHLAHATVCLMFCFAFDHLGMEESSSPCEDLECKMCYPRGNK